jgi:hypothetical protein
VRWTRTGDLRLLDQWGSARLFTGSKLRQRTEVARRAVEAADPRDPIAVRKAVLELIVARRDAYASWAQGCERLLWLAALALYSGVVFLAWAAHLYFT